MKTRNSLFFGFVVLLLTTVSCRSHYQLSSVQRTRMLVDKRYDQQPDQQAAAYILPFKQHVDSVMNPVVGRTARYMERGIPEGLLSNLLPDILVLASPRYGETPDFAVYNYGGIRAALPAGDVTLGDILDVAPFENKICFGTLSGKDVLELFQQFTTVGAHVSHGVQLVYDKHSNLREATVNGKPVDPEGSYRFVTIDYVAQGNDGLKAFKKKTDFKPHTTSADNSRDLIIEYFREKMAKGELVDAQIEGRIQFEN